MREPGFEAVDDESVDRLVFDHEAASLALRDRARAEAAFAQERYEAAAEHARRRRLRCVDCGVRWARGHNDLVPHPHGPPDYEDPDEPGRLYG